jgi:hypothetical protein
MVADQINNQTIWTVVAHYAAAQKKAANEPTSVNQGRLMRAQANLDSIKDFVRRDKTPSVMNALMRALRLHGLVIPTAIMLTEDQVVTEPLREPA